MQWYLGRGPRMPPSPRDGEFGFGEFGLTQESGRRMVLRIARVEGRNFPIPFCGLLY
jgi:hypothetical protein